jgi:hypothetical protein
MGTLPNSDPRYPLQAQADARLLRWSVAFVWLVTGALVVVPEYRRIGSHYLERLHLPDWLMFATCAAEIALGFRLILGRMATWLAALQIGMVLSFTAILARIEPTMLASPFGMLAKNIPLLAAIGTAWLLEREGWTSRALWMLRAGVGMIWITEGIVPKMLYQQETELRVVAESGLVPWRPDDFLFWMGFAQAASGLGVLVLTCKPLRVLLACQLAALVALPILVSLHNWELWVHPFGPLTKNVPILAGTWLLLRRS